MEYQLMCLLPHLLQGKANDFANWSKRYFKGTSKSINATIHTATQFLSNSPARSPVAADAPKKYPVGRVTPSTSKQVLHLSKPSTSILTCNR